MVAWEFRPGPGVFRKVAAQVYENFPALGERRRAPARLLSGGQQQMLILSCAMIRDPRYLLLDEPSLGLAPIAVTQVFQFIARSCREHGTTVLLNEQMAAVALRVADFAYVLQRGRVVHEGKAQELLQSGASQVLSAAYLGGQGAGKAAQ